MFSFRVLFVVALAIAAVFAVEEVVRDKKQVLLGSYGLTGGYAGYPYAGYAGIPAVTAYSGYAAYPSAYPYGRYFY